MAESGTDPDVDGATSSPREDDAEEAVAAGGGTELPESVPDAYQQAAEAAADVRGESAGATG